MSSVQHAAVPVSAGHPHSTRLLPERSAAETAAQTAYWSREGALPAPLLLPLPQLHPPAPTTTGDLPELTKAREAAGRGGLFWATLEFEGGGVVVVFLNQQVSMWEEHLGI